MHIFWCFMHKHCIIIHYIQDYFTPKFYVENRLLAKPHIYTSFSLYRANPYQCLYRWSFWHFRLLFSAHQFLAQNTKKRTHHFWCALYVFWWSHYSICLLSTSSLKSFKASIKSYSISSGRYMVLPFK